MGVCVDMAYYLLRLGSGNRLTAYRTILNAAPASGTKIHVDAACTLSDLYPEISGRAFDRFKISISDQFDI